MCYTAESLTLKSYKQALHIGDKEWAAELEKKLQQLRELKIYSHYHVSGFAHPKLLVFTNINPLVPQLFYWGLIPMWTKNIAEGKKFWNNTLNARGETIFEKPSFKNSAKYKRCLICLDSFYEYHHANKRTYPFRINMKNGDPLVLGGLWEEYADKETGEIFNTCTIVTTQANPLMKRIHNNPKAEGPRMPLILTGENQLAWLMESDADKIQKLIKPLNEAMLSAYTVGQLKGKAAIGNIPEALEEVIYPELIY